MLNNAALYRGSLDVIERDTSNLSHTFNFKRTALHDALLELVLDRLKA